MTRVARHTVEGVVTALAGVLLWVFTDGVETPVVTLSKVGMVLTAVGAAQLAVTLILELGRRRA
ncbi:hypothetical protein EBN88_15915 [Streptomyces triticirhizae]|uniref:Uncharacterized protein n=1 Tax=Streptomyces triticirhizae TaxID=2483353 RepID=A0A3M2LQU2_9ACTN|nr:hypothetical protein EBN88_15915 [Streptomyces triticirhizae]